MTRPADGAPAEATSSEQPSLPANRAFVLQFVAPPRRGSSCRGRIEHVKSGKTALFASWKQVRDFVHQMLAEVARQAR